MSSGFLITLLVLLLIGLFSLTAVNNAFRRLQRKDTKKQIDAAGKLFFYQYLNRFILGNHEFERLFFAGLVTLNIVRFCYAIVSIFILVGFGLIHLQYDLAGETSFVTINWPAGTVALSGLFLLFFLIGDYLPRLLSNRYPEAAFRVCAFFVSFFMVITFPITFIFLKFAELIGKTHALSHFEEPETEAKQQIIDIIEESTIGSTLDIHDKILIESVMAFKDRIAREVMVPRVDVFSLPYNTTIREAALSLQREGYSRIPVYQETLDNIIGVLMYKEVLTKYLDYVNTDNEAILDAPISTLLKSVIYTPETKKISHLLQEFRKKQVHLAIVVDEYGGTEGIVTIEDILEEIVGEIADEYDEELALFVALPEGGWLVDARMGILDIEEQFGIEIPQNGDYDTIGGYIFHETGMIPEKGFIIHQPNFELEVVRSSDRSVEKVRLKPVHQQIEDTQHETNYRET